MAGGATRRNLFPGSGAPAPAGAFTCAHCGTTVPVEAPGTRQRNHCPRCLRSLHVDLAVGDRRSLCRGLMDPIGAWVRTGGELALLHRCRRCGTIRSNRVAGDDDLALVRDCYLELGRALAEPEPGARASPALTGT